MPNTVPDPHSPELMADLNRRVEESAWCGCYPSPPSLLD
ncbi:dihydroorotase [Cutibacterium acnes JCM 18920]|nr:dihydroorotase [Cutibacterium acnes JCM 18920]